MCGKNLKRLRNLGDIDFFGEMGTGIILPKNRENA
jgi:hypothetical protein